MLEVRLSTRCLWCGVVNLLYLALGVRMLFLLAKSIAMGTRTTIASSNIQKQMLPAIIAPVDDVTKWVLLPTVCAVTLDVAVIDLTCSLKKIVVCCGAVEC